MTYSIPISVAMRAALSDSTKRYLKVTITHDGPIVFYPTKISGNVSEEYQSWNIQLKNYGEYTEGLFAGDLATVSFSHDGAEWITIMTGYVSPEGMNREQGFVSDDIVTFDLVDRTKGKGTKRKPSSTVFAALKICDPSDTANSILHRLGSLMGITSFEVGLIQDVKDIVVLGEQVVWSELKLLRDAYKASMYFDYLGRMRFHSPLEIGWTDPETEWTFIADPSHELDSSSSRVIGKVRRTYNQVSCNRATSTLNLFEQRSSRVIYRDTTNWNSDLSQCSIVIQPGATYPENGVLSLSYKDPSTGEEYPYATSVQTPSIGQSRSYDICYAGGRLSLVSFNGSDSMTTQQPGASQIILKNTGSLSCEIIKFEVRGIPFLQLSENKVEEVDSSITDEVDYVDLSVEGKYATSVDQIDKVLARHVEEGKIRTRHFSFATIFLPQIQREMACTYIDTDGSEILCKVITYSHKSAGRTLDSMRTYVELDELLSYVPVYNPRIQTSNPSSPVPIPGTPGDRVVTQFTLGDESGPFPTGWTIGQDGWEIGQDDWVLGQDDWTYEPPTPGDGEYVYKRVGTYNPATESWPSVWRITRDTGLKGDQGLQGLQGLQGPQGDQGIQGPVGEDGLTAYNHIAYADDAIGTGFSQDPTGKSYIGFYADHTAADSTDPEDYAWSLIKGADGAQGIQGPVGEDGLTAYFHTAWSNSADGAADFSTTVSAGKTYIGTYSDHTAADSTDPADYAWVLIKGDPARALTLYADSTVINLSSRNELKTQEIEITCAPSNLPIESAVWTATDDGSLSLVEIAEGVYDPYKRVLNCSLVTGNSTLITVSIEYGGQTHIGYVGITKVSEGIPTPMYLDALSTVPTLTSDGPLIVGDFFLYVGPYSGPNTDPGNQGLNPPALEINEFVYGRIYEYKGKSSADVDQWQESRKSSHLAAAQKDALQIAKDSNTYMFVAVLVAQLGLFFDLIVAGILSSPNYAEDASGVPTAGFKIDGVKGLIKALGLEAYEAMIYGNLEASGFRTLQEEAGTSISPASVTPTLWKHSEMEALIASQDTLATLSGTIEGFSFNKATRRSNQRVLLASHGYESEDISASESHYFTRLYPSKVFSSNVFYCEYSGYYEGYSSKRLYCAYMRDDDYQIGEHQSVSYTVAKTYSLALPVDGLPVYPSFRLLHSSAAIWGTRGSHVNYHKVWASQVFTGLVLVNGETSYKVIEPEPTAYYPNTKTWQIGSVTQADKDNYCSGTAFYSLFSALAIGADGYCDGGQINVNGTLYTVTRLTKNANSITFYTSGGVVTVNKFQEGTSIGVYTALAVTQAINFQAVAGGIEVKHIFPWGTQAGSPGTYDIGTANERFNTAWLNILDVLNAVRFRSTLQVDGVASVASINTGGLGAFLIGQNLRTTDSPTFAGLTLGTINTGYGDNEVYRVTNESFSLIRSTGNMGAMEVGEIRFVFAAMTGDDGGGTDAYLKLPSGGTYRVVPYSSGVQIVNIHSAGISGGTTIAQETSGSIGYVSMLVRRIS